MWDLSSPTRGRTRPPAAEAHCPNHWTARDVPALFINYFKILLTVFEFEIIIPILYMGKMINLTKFSKLVGGLARIKL